MHAAAAAAFHANDFQHVCMYVHIYLVAHAHAIPWDNKTIIRQW